MNNIRDITAAEITHIYKQDGRLRSSLNSAKNTFTNFTIKTCKVLKTLRVTDFQ